MRVLVVEDEPEVREFLVRVLREATWAADVATNGAAALTLFAVNPYDLAVVDVGLPDLDGFALCRALRASGNRTPVLLLTARNAVNDRVRGLDAGADDYLAKPFAVSELLARLRALARRPSQLVEPVLALADLTLDPASRRVERAGQVIALTAREYALLEYLMRHPRRVCTRANIFDHVWDDNFDPIGNVIETLVARLRRKIDQPGLTPLLVTVRGAGYALTDEAPDAV